MKKITLFIVLSILIFCFIGQSAAMAIPFNQELDYVQVALAPAYDPSVSFQIAGAPFVCTGYCSNFLRYGRLLCNQQFHLATPISMTSFMSSNLVRICFCSRSSLTLRPF